jgi:transposase InsO family protein
MKSKSWCSPGQLLMLMLAGWINRLQQTVIAYQKEEIKVLREMLGCKRLRFTDGQRRRLALKAQALSRCTLKELGSLVTPDTLCRWFRQYAGAKYDSSEMRRPGRPPKPQYIRDLVMRLAKENTNWGYTKLRDVMFTLGHKIGRTTVQRILAEDGIEPAPERRKHMPWATFLKAHWGTIAAMDFFKVEVMTLFGPVRYSVLVVMDLKTRHVEVAGIVCEAYEKWMLQVLRNLTDALDGFLLGKTHLIMDRDPIFTAGVREMLRHAGTKPVRLPRRSPNLNAFIERFIRSIKEECLDRVIPLGEAHLRELIREYTAHYYAERPHQGLGDMLIQPANDHATDGLLARRERLGGLLNYYYREAA